MTNWVCYLIFSLNNNRTYIGSTNNFPNRLKNHNSRKGAKYTKGNQWVPYLIISGFENKFACLSFEYGWKKISKKRKSDNLLAINLLYLRHIKYTKNSLFDRVIDLLYFTHNVAYVKQHFRWNLFGKIKSEKPYPLKIKAFFCSNLEILPWCNWIHINNEIINY